MGKARDCTWNACDRAATPEEQPQPNIHAEEMVCGIGVSLASFQIDSCRDQSSVSCDDLELEDLEALFRRTPVAIVLECLVFRMVNQSLRWMPLEQTFYRIALAEDAVGEIAFDIGPLSFEPFHCGSRIGVESPRELLLSHVIALLA